MGSPKTVLHANDDERPEHKVTITKSFHIGVFEITQSQYEKVMGENPSFFSTSGGGKDKVAGQDTSRFPVERLTWQDAMEFCKRLSAMPKEKMAGRVYRLPTEAEWEYACRAGSGTQFHYGKALTSKLANFNGKFPTKGEGQGPFLARPTTVGSYPPNKFGLYDMHGNVWEWCSDWYQPDFYQKSSDSDPQGAESGGDRSVRGGSWADDALNCRSSYRYNVLPVRNYQTRGFRVVMTSTNGIDTNAVTNEAVEQAPAVANLSRETIEREQVFQAEILPFLQEYCFECHSGPDPSAEFRLEVFDNSSTIITTGHRSWKKVADKLLAGVMPPADSKQPPPADNDSITRWISVALSQIDCSGPPDPGHETIRRLNRVEYKNTVRDLLAVDYEPAKDFPTDDVGAGGDALSLPPILMERYLSAAEEISRQVVDGEKERTTRQIVFVRPGNQLSRRQASREILRRLASRAYRRPATDVELERLLGLTDKSHEQGGNFEDGIGLAIQAILVSPHFLFKVEQTEPQAVLEDLKPLNEFELATRLSYFLWSSMPDEELFDQAEENTLRKNLETQVSRMLADPKSVAFVKNFASSWLELDKLESFSPDRDKFHDFDRELRVAMRTETEKFLEAIIGEDRSVLDLIDGDFTILNERLARHYKMDGIEGPGFRRISLKETNRRGILTHGSILALTSNPTRTSPVKRGKWIMTNFLDAAPAAPPPGVSELSDDSNAGELKSLRQRMEVHRKNPRCANCHEPMDSLGFALENFDAIGRWRTSDGKTPIDASGSLPSGEEFSGAQQLTTLLRKHQRNEFARCLVRKMLAYALGRELEYFDYCTVKKIVGELEKNDYKFSTMLIEIVKSVPFQKNGPR